MEENQISIGNKKREQSTNEQNVIEIKSQHTSYDQNTKVSVSEILISEHLGHPARSPMSPPSQHSMTK